MATLIRNTHQDSLCFCWRSCRSWQFWSWLIWFSLSWWLLWFWWASQALNKASFWAETETLMSLKQNHSKKFCEFGNFPFQPLSHPFPPTPRPHRVPGCVWGILLWLWTWNNTATCFKKKPHKHHKPTGLFQEENTLHIHKYVDTWPLQLLSLIWSYPETMSTYFWPYSV